MRVLHITARADVGGGPEHIAQLAGSLLSSCDQFIACPPDKPYFERFCRLVGSDRVFAIPHRKFTLIALRKLAKFVIKNEIEIVHSHGKGAGVYSRLLTILTAAKSIHTFHGVHIGGYNKSKFVAYAAYERILALRTTCAIAVSQGELEHIGRTKLFPLNRIKVIPNGVEIGKEPSPVEHVGATTLRIASVNRFDFQKNPDALIDIADVIRRLHPSLEWELRIYGEGEHKEKIRNRINELGLGRRVKLPGNVDSMRPALRESDLFLSSSRWEGLPIAVLEAMSEGLPVVLSDVVGNRDLVNGNGSGRLFDLDKIDQAADFINELRNKELRERMGKAGRATVQAKYSVQTMSNRTLRVYRDACSPNDEASAW